MHVDGAVKRFKVPVSHFEQELVARFQSPGLAASASSRSNSTAVMDTSLSFNVTVRVSGSIRRLPTTIEPAAPQTFRF